MRLLFGDIGVKGRLVCDSTVIRICCKGYSILMSQMRMSNGHCNSVFLRTKNIFKCDWVSHDYK
jgi:hypothetical protein